MGFYSGGEDYFSHAAGSYDFRNDSRQECGAGCSRVFWEGKGAYSTNVFSERAISVIKQHDPEIPLFLYLAYQAVRVWLCARPKRCTLNEQFNPYRSMPHRRSQCRTRYRTLGRFWTLIVEPLPGWYDSHLRVVVPATDREGARCSRTGAVRFPLRSVWATSALQQLSCMDEGIGNVTAALATKGMLDNTLIIFTSDNVGSRFSDDVSHPRPTACRCFAAVPLTSDLRRLCLAFRADQFRTRQAATMWDPTITPCAVRFTLHHCQRCLASCLPSASPQS